MHSSIFNSRYLAVWSLKALLCLIVFITLPQWLMPDHAMIEKWKWAHEKRDEIVALSLGDSSGVALQFDQLGQTGLNLCSPSGYVEIEISRAKIVLRKLPAVRTVYYQLAAQSLHHRPDPERDYFEDLPFDASAFLVDPSNAIRSLSMRFKNSLRWRDLWKHRQALPESRMHKVYRGELVEGTATWDEIEREVKAWKKKESTLPRDLDLNTRTNLQLLSSFADELGDKDIKLIVILLSESPVFAANSPELYPYFDQVRSLAAHPNVRLIDLSQLHNDLPAGSANVYFEDMVHLNTVGAAKYNAALKRLLNPSE